jgi:hypothetical protein
MKRYLVMLFVLAFSAAVVSAADKAATEPADMTLKGKLEKKEVTGAAKAKITYTLETKDYGKVELSKTDIKLDELVGQDVEMVVKAVVKEKEGKKHVKVTEVVSVKKVEAPAAPAAPAVPAAPAAPTAPAK